MHGVPIKFKIIFFSKFSINRMWYSSFSGYNVLYILAATPIHSGHAERHGAKRASLAAECRAPLKVATGHAMLKEAGVASCERLKRCPPDGH